MTDKVRARVKKVVELMESGATKTEACKKAKIAPLTFHKRLEEYKASNESEPGDGPKPIVQKQSENVLPGIKMKFPYGMSIEMKYSANGEAVAIVTGAQENVKDFIKTGIDFL